MLQAKWNYSQDVKYKVVLVRLLAMPEQPYHWQNAFAGENRQAVWIEHDKYTFLIDNQDGTGLLKLDRGGGPDSYHASIAAYEYICDVQPEFWVQYRRELADKSSAQYDEWMQTNHPEKLKAIKALQKTMREGLMHIDMRGRFQAGAPPQRRSGSGI